MYTSVLHSFVEQLSQGKSYKKYCRLCTFTYIPENFMQKFDLDQKLLTILAFCFFKRNPRLFFDSTGRKNCKNLLKFEFQFKKKIHKEIWYIE